MQVVLLLACFFLPTVKVSMLFAASLFSGLLCAAGYRKGHVLLSYIAVSLLSMIFINNYIIPISYILFFGAYGIVHFATKAKKNIAKYAIRFVYLFVGLTALYFIFTAVFAQSPLLSAPYIYFLPVGVIVGYILFQILYDMVIQEFFKHKYLSDLISK